MSEKGLPARAIYGFDGTNWVKVKVDADGKVYITNTDLTTILAAVQHTTYGLSALKTLIDSIIAKTDLIPAGGIATEDKQDTIIDKTENLPSDPADESAVEAAITAAHSATETKIERKITHMDFWADNTAQVILTTIATADYALSALTVAGIPNGATLVRVVALLKIAVIRDTSASNNAVNGATALKVDADVAYGSLVTAIDIADNSWAVLVANGADRGGDIMIGDNDVKTEITGNGIFYARLENIACDGNNLSLEDVAWGVRVYFY
jgi:hypothetical protein